MKTIALIIAVTSSLALRGSALAGSADPGGTRTVRLGPQTTTAQRRLVGHWKLVSVESGARRMAVPATMRMVFELRADGTALLHKGTRSKAGRRLGRWIVRNGAVVLTKKGARKPEVMKFQLKGDALSFEPVRRRSGNVRIHLQRVR